MAIKLPKVKLVYDRKKKATKKISGVIEVEIYYNGRQYRATTGISVTTDQWSGVSVVKRLDCVSLNNQIAEIVSRATEYAMECHKNELPSLDQEKFKELATTKPSVGIKKGFIEWLEERIENRDIKESTRRQHKVMMRSMQDSKLFKTFADLTTANIKAWDDILHKQLGCQSSVHGYHKRLKPYIADAIQLGLIKRSPYESLRIKRGGNTSIKYFLTLSLGHPIW